MFKKLVPYLKEYKKYAILSPIMVFFEVTLEISMPFLMSKIIDVGIKNKDFDYVLKTGIIMVVIAILALIFGALAGRFSALGSVGLAKGLREKLFEKVQDFSFSNIDKFSTGSLVTRLTTDVTNVQQSFMMVIRQLVRAPLMLILATLMTFSINKSLVTVFLIAIPILAVSLFIIIMMAFPKFQKMLNKYDEMNANVQENLIAIKVVKAFVRSDYEKEKFTVSADELMQAQKKAEKILSFNNPIMQLVMYSTIISVLWFGGNMVVSGSMLTGELISFINYVSQILMSLMMISFVFVGLVLSKASIVRIVEVIDEVPDIQNNDSDRIMNIKDGSIEFDNVSFSYKNENENLAIDDANLKIESGDTVAIIGGTGSSKSTLVQLIPRLYDTIKGRVLVGGVDVRDYDLDELRNEVAIVLQKNVLFSGTIKENLKWGNADASDDELETACKIAQAHDFIMSFPEKYETVLEQGGTNLSGGQRQRVCIARALLKNPKILILDDSTSAVDTDTEGKIREGLSETLKDTTKLIISQRLSSIEDADKIVILSDGKINAIGKHDDLLKNNDIYREVYESQQKGADL